MKDRALIELTKAEALINNWMYLPGSQVKVLVTHLVRVLDTVASYALNRETILEQSYLTLSRVRLFSDARVEHEFYDTYYFLKNLLRKDIHRVNRESVRIIGPKQVLIENKEYFEELISAVKEVFEEAFS